MEMNQSFINIIHMVLAIFLEIMNGSSYYEMAIKLIFPVVLIVASVCLFILGTHQKKE